MGTWSSSLYGNDTTCDVRDAYMSFLKEQLGNDDAYKKTLERFRETINGDEGSLFWFALAETQWKVGRLTADVKEKALYWIEQGGGLELWLENDGKGTGWLKTLEKLKQKLESPMPPEKKIKSPEELDMNPWEIHDVYAYQFHKRASEEKGIFGKYMLIQKIGHEDYWIAKDKYTAAMRVQFYDKIFDELPMLDDLQGLRILPLDLPDRINISEDRVNMYGAIRKKVPIRMSTLLLLDKKSEYPKKHLTFLGNVQGLSNVKTNNWEFSWLNIETWLHDSYEKWQGIEYDTVGYGEYDYLGNLNMQMS